MVSKQTALDLASKIGDYLNPIFNILMLDVLTRKIDDLFNAPALSTRIPAVGREAIQLVFNFARLKISASMARGIPYVGGLVQFGVKLSALQIALDSLPVFLDPKNYEIPRSSGDSGNAIATTTGISFTVGSRVSGPAGTGTITRGPDAAGYWQVSYDMGLVDGILAANMRLI